MLSLLRMVDGPWEKVRGYLRLDLEAIQSAINQRWSATFGDKNVLPPAAGGLGLTPPFVVGDLLEANTTTTLARLADVATGNALISGGVGVVPLYGKIGLTTHVSGLLPVGNGGTGTDLSVGGLVGDLLSAVNSTTFTRIPMAVSGSVLVSTTGAAARWVTALSLGVAGTGSLLVNGKISAVYTQTDIAEFTLNIAATLPAVTTSTRTGINLDVTTAGSSAHIQQGCSFTLEAGYTGASECIAIISQTNVASAGFVSGYKARVFGASAVNVGVNSFVGNGTQNIALFAGLNNQDAATFSSGISGCLVGTNSTTGSNLIDLYNNVTSACRVSGTGTLTLAGGIVSNGGNIQCAAAAFITWNSLTALSSPADGVINVTKQSTVTGFALDGTTDGVCKIRTRGSAADAAITHAAYTHSGAENDKTYQIYAPVTGGTVTMSANQSRAIINPLAGLALLTVTLPPTPVDSQVAGFSFTQTIAGLTVNAPGGATVVAPPTTAAVDSNFRFLYQASSTSWFPCS